MRYTVRLEKSFGFMGKQFYKSGTMASDKKNSTSYNYLMTTKNLILPFIYHCQNMLNWLQPSGTFWALERLQRLQFPCKKSVEDLWMGLTGLSRAMSPPQTGVWRICIAGAATDRSQHNHRGWQKSNKEEFGFFQNSFSFCLWHKFLDTNFSPKKGKKVSKVKKICKSI